MAGNVGGRIDVTIDGRLYQMAGEIKAQEANIEPEAVTNTNGSIGRSVKPVPYEVDVTFRQMAGLSIQDLMSRTFDFSAYERDLGKWIIMTGAFITGKPSRNTINGEISGLKIVSDQWRAV